MTDIVFGSGIIIGTGISVTPPPLGVRAIFGYGTSYVTNIVSNTGVVANDVAGVGTNRTVLAAAGYGGDKAIFGY